MAATQPPTIDIGEQHRIVQEKMAAVDSTWPQIPVEAREEIKKEIWDTFVKWSSSQVWLPPNFLPLSACRNSVGGAVTTCPTLTSSHQGGLQTPASSVMGDCPGVPPSAIPSSVAVPAVTPTGDRTAAPDTARAPDTSFAHAATGTPAGDKDNTEPEPSAEMLEVVGAHFDRPATIVIAAPTCTHVTIVRARAHTHTCTRRHTHTHPFTCDVCLRMCTRRHEV